jgi:hypothetical protein
VQRGCDEISASSVEISARASFSFDIRTRRCHQYSIHYGVSGPAETAPFESVSEKVLESIWGPDAEDLTRDDREIVGVQGRMNTIMTALMIAIRK